MSDKPTPVIRNYRPEDRDAVRKICCDTAYRNKGAELFFEDREIHADYWSSYYTDVTPEEVRIVEVDGQIVGYFFGCPDTSTYRRYMAWRIVPSCVLRGLWRLATGRYKNPVSKRYLWFMITKAPAEEAPLDVKEFPAHFHCNITDAGRGLNLYTNMTLQFIDRLEAAGITKMHGHITEPAKRGIWDIFERQFSDEEKPSGVFRSEKPTKSFEYLLGDPTPMVNRAWGCDTDVFRQFVTFLQTRMRF